MEAGSDMRLVYSLSIPALFLALSAHGVRAQAAELQLAPGDRVRVEVAGDSTLSGDFDVDADGTVLIPLVGLVPVQSRPFSEVASDIVGGFEAELVGIPVRVIPLLRVPVLGEVAEPGLFWVDRTMSLAEVLAVAGGLTESAQRDDIRVERGDQVLIVTAETPGSVDLLPRDRVFVGRRSFFAENASLFIGAGASVLAALVTSLILR